MKDFLEGFLLGLLLFLFIDSIKRDYKLHKSLNKIEEHFVKSATTYGFIICIIFYVYKKFHV